MDEDADYDERVDNRKSMMLDVKRSKNCGTRTTDSNGKHLELFVVVALPNFCTIHVGSFRMLGKLIVAESCLTSTRMASMIAG